MHETGAQMQETTPAPAMHERDRDREGEKMEKKKRKTRHLIHGCDLLLNTCVASTDQ